MEMKIIKESIKIIKKSPKLILITIILYILCSFFTCNLNNFSRKIFFRRINEIETNKNSNNSYMPQYPLVYYFFQNISKHYYFGEWKYLNIKNNIFQHKKGDSEFKFGKNSTGNFITGLESKNSTITIYFFLKDGEYIDYFFRGNFSFSLPHGFSDTLNNSITKNKNFTIQLKKVNMSYFIGEYFDDYQAKSLEENDINITFVPRERHFSNNQNYEIGSTLFSRVYFSINNVKEQFSTQFYGIMYGGGSYTGKTLNYSIALTIMALIQIYYSTIFIGEMSENNQISLNTDLFTVSIQIMWDSLVCAVNFFLAITNESSSYEYGMPSMTFFALFSIFQLRILFLAWKSRYNELLFDNISLFRKKLFQFYTIFYCALFICLISIRLIFEYYILTYLVFFSTWIFQIYHSAKSSTKPPMSFTYIFIFTLFKMLIPIYVKAYPSNLFELQPAYKKVIIIVITLFIEGIILSLQKILGPKFFIPKFLKGEQYDYYRNLNEVTENDLESICAICLVKIRDDPTKESDIRLELLSNEQNNYMENDNDEYDEKKITLGEKLIKVIEGWKNNLTKKPLMVTPCHHIYHSICLEKCLQSKNVCPYCRSQIPSIDDL